LKDETLESIDDEYSKEYGRYSRYPARRFSYLERLEIIKHYIDKKDAVLDIGTATCDYDIDFQDSCKEIISLDINKKSLSIAKKKRGGLNAVCADVHSLPIIDESFDVIIIMNAFRYFNSPSLALRECSRVLRKNGRLVLLEHNRLCPDSLIDKGDVVSYYSITQIKKLLEESGFKPLIERYLLVPFRLMPSSSLIPFQIISSGIERTLLRKIYPEMIILSEKSLVDNHAT